ncbi:MAG TPA: hypothetical protein EYF98_07140 [Planctomycetes bacterium]|nr:hypothetical protein [Planctomycetota bacterium]
MSDQPHLAREAVDKLKKDQRVTLGESKGQRLAVATETKALEEQEQLHASLLAQRGVVHVDTTFVELDEVQTSGSQTVENK